MLTRSELKEKARGSLTGKYGDAIVVVILLFIISSVVSFTIKRSFNIPSYTNYTYNISINLASFIISALLSFGYNSFFLKISRDEDVEINELWSKMNLFIPYIVVSILVSASIYLANSSAPPTPSANKTKLCIFPAFLPSKITLHNSSLS